MKQTLLMNSIKIVGIFVATFIFSVPSNAAYVTVPCSGFTADVVANGVGNPLNSTDSTFDAAGFYLLDSSYRYTVGGIAPAHALSPSGYIQSVATSGLAFQLASFSGANSLRIDVSNSPKTLTFTNPVSASQVFVLGATGSGAGVISISVNFTDATSQTFTAQSLPDWFNGTGFAIQGIGRVNSANSQPTGVTAPTDPRLYQKTLTLSAANYTKLISGITVTRTSTAGVINIMAVSIATPPVGIQSLENTAATMLQIVPNPVISDFNVYINNAVNSTDVATVKIYSIIGKLVYSSTQAIINENKLAIRPDKALPSGIYLLETEINSKQYFQKFSVK
ncbi:MAG TPA: T9SS type A sorting domain-containing protein [Bacteroidia bacterium]|nr:T9SS type A sorting domain-containing protein [Bacteroidia bacterium]